MTGFKKGYRITCDRCRCRRAASRAEFVVVYVQAEGCNKVGILCGACNAVAVNASPVPLVV